MFSYKGHIGLWTFTFYREMQTCIISSYKHSYKHYTSKFFYVSKDFKQYLKGEDFEDGQMADLVCVYESVKKV